MSGGKDHRCNPEHRELYIEINKGTNVPTI